MNNIDPVELKKFSAGDWWDAEHGEYAMLHQLNPIRLEWLQQQLNLLGASGVDLGCGGGIFTEALAKCGAMMTGVDLNESALEQARAHAAQENLSIHYVHSTIESFAETHAGTFDFVSCMELLEHVPIPEQIVEASAKLVKPDGLVFFSTINRTPMAYLKAVVAAEYILKLLPCGTHDYQKFIKPSELVNAASTCDLELVTLNGVKFNPFNKQFSLVRKPEVNYLVGFKNLPRRRCFASST